MADSLDDIAPASGHRPQISAYKIIPSMLTLMAMIAGVTSVQKSINQDFDGAVLMIVIAAVFDVLDGAVARALKAQSEFGAELDSLSDFLAFGIAPSVLLYVWLLDETTKFAWVPIAMVIFPIAAALRLARFNIAGKKQDDTPLWKKRYFTGVPSPAGAGLVLLPVYVWLMFQDTFREFAVANWLIGVWTVIVAALMVSRIPTFSLKYMKLPPQMLVPMMGFVALILAALMRTPWVTLTIIASCYALSIPLVFIRYRRLEKKYHPKPEDLSSLAFGMASDDILLAEIPQDGDDDEELRPLI